MGKKIDNNIVLLRFAAIALIVYHHSISSLCGWPPMEICLPTLPKLVIYSSSLTKNVGLVLFTFISGYLITFTNKPYCLSYILKKFKKLFLPCFIVATLYYFLFPSMMFDSDLVNGTHLWYLPMILLFYVFSPAVNTRSFPKSIVFIFLTFGSYVLLGRLTSLRTFSECARYWPAFVGGIFVVCIQTANYRKKQSLLQEFSF